MIEKTKLFGILIWYYPTKENVFNINSYIDYVHKLIIIDNSDVDNSHLLAHIEKSKIIYKGNNQNKGMATALNQGCKFALESGSDWVLTMDQDSCFFENNLSSFLQFVNEYTDFTKVAIFAPIHFDSRNITQKQVFENTYSKLNYTMTSGNLLSLEKLQKTGFFLEDLFIDWVDEEICIRFCKLQFQIVQINPILMEHFVGNGTGKTTIFGISKYFDDYAPIRFYYITRNVFILSKMYPLDADRLKKRWKRLILKTVKYDNKNKWTKIKYVVRGILDYTQGITGPIIEASKKK